MAILDLNHLTQQGLLPHGICLSWKPELLLLHVLSDSLIAVAYFSIPFGIAHFVSRRNDLEYRWMFILFASFIMACGTTHLLDIWTLWHPDYGLQGIIKAITAIISVASAILLWPVIGKALHLPSPRELARINYELQREIKSRQETVIQLEREAMERQRLEERLRQNEARLQAVLNTTVEGILSINADGCVELANHAASKMFGTHIPEDGSALISELIRAEESSNHSTKPMILQWDKPDLRGIRADGSTFPIEVSVGVYGRGHDDAPLYTCVVRDMTERRRNEQLVREKETQLKQQENQLMMIQRQNTAGELAAMVSHEINQPLGAIANYLGGISLRYQDQLNENPGLKDTIEETIRLAKRTSQIIQGIRNLIRRRPSDAIPIDVHALTEETLLLLNSQLARKQIQLATHYDPELPFPIGERIQIQQLLLNLMLNAIDALEARNDEARNLHVELRSSNPNLLKIIIHDNGCGFDARETARIFEPFYTTKESGMGLGLSICKSVVEAHNGIISADSGPEAPDSLSNFLVVQLKKARQMNEETVFVVDDDLDMRTSLQWLLESIGLKVELFESAEAFLAANRLEHPGCLILDVRMPGIGGLRLLEQIRNQGYRTPTIILTGHGEIAMAVQSMKTGAFDFLEKPTSPQVILERVQDALKLDRETREKNRESRLLDEKISQLTRREKEILALLVSGESTRGIAERLFISERTVEKHRENLLAKMEAHSMIELIRRILEYRGGV